MGTAATTGSKAAAATIASKVERVTTVRDLDRCGAVGVLPVGAVEAHGPHLPVSTDVIIAEAMARACAEELEAAGRTALILPPLWYSSAGFAAGFPGTISVTGTVVSSTIVDVARSLGEHDVETLAVANAHLDPGHLGALRDAVAAAPPRCRIVCVDLTRRAAAARLRPTGVVMTARP